jgi:hypothetical protein
MLYYTFPSDTNKANFVSKGKERLQKGEIARGPIFFPSGRIFPPSWPENACQELAPQ